MIKKSIRKLRFLIKKIFHKKPIVNTALEVKYEFCKRFNKKPELLDSILDLMEIDQEKGIGRKEILKRYFWH